MHRQAARRIKGATSRLENQPYDMLPRRRTPRLGGAWGFGLIRLGSSLGPATGTWPSLTPTSATGITIYRPSGGSLVAIPGSSSLTIHNWRNVTWAAGKTTYVVPVGDGTWMIVDQDC